MKETIEHLCFIACVLMRYSLIVRPYRIINKPQTLIKCKTPLIDFRGRFEVVPNDGELAPNLLMIAHSLVRP